MASLNTYDLKGNKQSFANWISNLSPTDTPFASMIGKEKVDQTQYTWQTDSLSKPINTGFQEGSAFALTAGAATTEHTNFTQILRKVVRIADTAKAVSLYGRASEKAYQMEKAGKELKRDLEVTMLSDQTGTIGSSGTASLFTGAFGLVAAKDAKDTDTGAVVHSEVETDSGDTFTVEDLFNLTYNLYLVGAKANKVMVHPKHMGIFADLVGFSKNLHTHRMFDNVDTKFNLHIGKVRDSLGQEFDIIPNRYMPVDTVFVFNEKDWTQMVLREPATTELAKNGSAEKHMIEMEVGLRHRNPFASGLLVLKKKVTP